MKEFMKEYSEAEVVDAINKFNEAKQSFPDSGELKTSVDTLGSITEILNECWQTSGGEKELAKLKELITAVDNVNLVESEISTYSGINISYEKKKVVDGCIIKKLEG